MITVENLCIKYINGKNEICILNHANYSFDGGKMTAIVGRSGSGKSSLLNVLGGLICPNEGTVNIDGVNITEMTANRMAVFRNSKIGFVFQSFYLDKNLTALENVMLPLIPRKIKKSEKIIKAKQALAYVGLEEREKHKPGQLSGGEQQRVAIARAIVTNPTVIFADEPTGNLDIDNGENIMRLLKKLASEGKTVILVTHDPQEASLCDEIVEILNGKIVTKEG